MTYVEFAPPLLIRLFERRSLDGSFSLNANRELLERLLHNRKMRAAWKTIRKYIKTDASYEDLWKNILRSQRHAWKGSVRDTDPRTLEAVNKARNNRYLTIAGKAEELVKLIEAPATMPLDGSTPIYDGELDLPAYEFLPDDLARIYGAQGFSTLRNDERFEWATSLLNGHSWPTMVQLLQELAKMSRQLKNSNSSVVKRDRGNAYWVIFVRKLYEYLVSVNRKFASEGFAPITAIANAAMVVKWERQIREYPHRGLELPPKPQSFSRGKVRAMICGSSGKRPIKGSRKQALK